MRGAPLRKLLLVAVVTAMSVLLAADADWKASGCRSALSHSQSGVVVAALNYVAANADLAHALAPEIARLETSSTPEIQGGAVRVFASIGESAPVLRALSDPYSFRASAALDAMSAADLRTNRKLIGPLLRSKDDVLMSAILAVGRSELVEYAESIASLGDSGPDYVKRLALQTAVRLAIALKTGKRDMTELLGAALQYPDRGMQLAAVDGLSPSLADEYAPLYLKALGGDSANVAIRALGNMKARKHAAAVAGFLTAPDNLGTGLIRTEAINALGNMEAMEYAAKLVETLKADPDTAQTCARALIKMRAVEQTGPLTALLDAREPYVRQAAIETLGGMKAVPKTAWARLLSDKNEGVRASAAEAAGLAGCAAGADPLLQLALDDDLEVRSAAAESLRSCGPITWQRALPLLQSLSPEPSMRNDETTFTALLITGGAKEMAVLAGVGRGITIRDRLQAITAAWPLLAKYDALRKSLVSGDIEDFARSDRGTWLPQDREGLLLCAGILESAGSDNAAALRKIANSVGAQQ
jgi:HEAT repeat protein